MKTKISYVITVLFVIFTLVSCSKPAKELLVNTWQGDSAGTDSIIPETTGPTSGTMTADQAMDLFRTTALQEKLRVAKAQIKGATFQFFTDGSCHMTQMIENQKVEYFGKYNFDEESDQLIVSIDRIKDPSTGNIKSSTNADTLKYEVLTLEEHSLRLKEILSSRRSGMLGTDIPMTLKFVTSQALNQ